MKTTASFKFFAFCLFLLSASFLATGAVFAAESSVAPSTSVGLNQSNQAAKIVKIKTRAEAEIDKRLASLNSALAKISTAKKLPESDKANFSAQIQAATSKLNALRAKIDADTDLAILRTDAKSIFNDFRVYAVFLPQIHLLAAADTMEVTADNLTTLAGKLQVRLQAAQSKGKDVSQLQTLLTDTQAKIADAKTQYSAVINEVIFLTPTSYPGSNATLKDARAKIKVGTQDLRAARQDAKQIVAGLKAMGKSTSTSSPSTVRQ